MNIGSMKHRIEIVTIGSTVDEEGFPIEGEIVFKKVWARVNNLYGKEFWSAKAVQSENTVTFSIRYSKDLAELDTKRYKIKFQNRYFDIKHMDNVLYKNVELKIKAVEVV